MMQQQGQPANFSVESDLSTGRTTAAKSETPFASPACVEQPHPTHMKDSTETTRSSQFIDEKLCDDSSVETFSHKGKSNNTQPEVATRKSRAGHSRQRCCSSGSETVACGPSPSPSLSTDLARKSTKAVNVLRVAVLMVLVLATALVSVGVHLYTRNEEENQFEAEYQNYAYRVIESFEHAVERRLTAINSMSTSITSFALATNQSFPFVTLPDFAIRGSDVRILADAMVIHYMPLVTDETREKWEEYALDHRFHIDEEFEIDQEMRLQQDMDMGHTATTVQEQSKPNDRILDENDSKPNTTLSVLEDGSGFHTRIWSAGSHTPLGDEAEGIGPYLPLWQRSPINAAKQRPLNWNFDNTFALHGVLPNLLKTKQAIMNRAVTKPVAEEAQAALKANLLLSQYRYDVSEFMDDPLTFIAYPVFDSFNIKDRQVAGVLATNIHWKLFFKRVLPPSADGIICVLENSYNQRLSYLIEGDDAVFLGAEDLHDPLYDYLEESTSINSFFQRQASPASWAYTTVPLSEEYGKYTLRVYPSIRTEQNYTSNDPLVYTCVVAAVFIFTSLVFISFALVVESRQQVVVKNAMENARKAANTERELNEFLSHEVRNPLSAALSACSFVWSAIHEQHDPVTTTLDNFKDSLKEDVKVIQTCLLFVNDFLRSMLDLHRAAVDKLEFTLSPICVLKDIIEPVCQMLYQRNVAVSISGDCADELVVMTDGLRIKQTLLNLAVNSLKFVQEGFIRIRAAVVDGLVELYVEDSGPGISPSKRAKLFDRYEDRLDQLTQGTGVGIGLSKSLIDSLNGKMFLDDSFDSGVPGNPGARFVIQLNKPPLHHEHPPMRTPSKSKIIVDITDVSGASSTGHGAVVEKHLPKLPENVSVLFVDDDTILRKLFVRAVKRVAPKWKIQQAPDGVTALQLADEDPHQFQIIFMDQYMPSTQKTLLGTETIQELRAKGVDSRICGLSANVLQDEFLAAGADCFMVKPIPGDQAQLEEWLLKVLG